MACEIFGFAHPQCRTHGDTVSFKCSTETERLRVAVRKLWHRLNDLKVLCESPAMAELVESDLADTRHLAGGS